MASPFGHSLIGLFLAGNARPKPRLANSCAWYAFAILAANAPDWDFLPGLLLDEPFRFHRGPAHSLLAAGLFGAIVYLLARRLTPRPGALAGLGFGCYASHLLLDLPGIPLFWPLSSVPPAIPWPSIGEAIGWERAGGTANFLQALFSKAFLQAMMVEAIVLLPALLALRGVAKYRPRSPFGRKILGRLRRNATSLVKRRAAPAAEANRRGAERPRVPQQFIGATALESSTNIP